jgi:hypothetical protein
VEKLNQEGANCDLGILSRLGVTSQSNECVLPRPTWDHVRSIGIFRTKLMKVILLLP